MARACSAQLISSSLTDGYRYTVYQIQLPIEIERSDTENKAKTMRQALKPQASFSSAYWTQNAKIAIMSKRSVELQKEISKQCGGVDTTPSIDRLIHMVHGRHV